MTIPRATEPGLTLVTGTASGSGSAQATRIAPTPAGTGGMAGASSNGTFTKGSASPTGPSSGTGGGSVNPADYNANTGGRLDVRNLEALGLMMLIAIGFVFCL